MRRAVLAAAATLLLIAVVGALETAGVVNLVERPRSANRIRLDGSPRRPSVEGVLARTSATEVELVGQSPLPLTEQAVSFSTYDRQPVAPRPGTYVHVGLDGDGRVLWMATIGVVARTEPPRVIYTGRLVDTRGGRATFADGTVLRVADALTPRLRAGATVGVRIDPTRKEAVELHP